ncbi:MAG: sugar phosphate nucleotidyltransferase [Candidatus Binatia bacterium]
MVGAATDGIWGLVLAGGDGTRLQPLTRRIAGAPIPKQYCRITGDRSLLEATLDRVAELLPAERTLVIVNRDHLPLASTHIRAVPAANVLVQPLNRDTGPGLLLSLLAIARRAPDATVAVFPSDHWVGDDATFVAHVARAAALIARRPEKLALLGIRPDRPEPGLGYIEPARRLPREQAAFHVARFREKPDPDVAAEVVRRGGLWNSFVMVFRVARVLRLLQRVRPADVAAVGDVGATPEALGAAYASLPPWNFSSHFLAAVPRDLVVLPVDDTPWSDWGTPEAIARTLHAIRQPLPWTDERELAAASA